MNGRAVFAGTSPHVRLKDGRVLTNLGRGPVGDALSTVQDGDPVSHPHDQAQVVLDDKDAEAVGSSQLRDKFAERVRLDLVRARRWLVEQQECGPGGKRPGDLDSALGSVRKCPSPTLADVGKTGLGEHPPRGSPPGRSTRMRRMKSRTNLNVLEHRHVAE